MKILNFLSGLACFLVIILYWYCVPYQVWLALVGQTAIGATMAYLVGLMLTAIAGVLVLVGLTMMAFLFWSD